MDQFFWILSGAAIFFGLIFVHELGHFMYGRFVMGIPKKRIKIVMNSWPQYVAIRNGANEEWLSPTSLDYQIAYKQYDKSLKKAWLFLSSGYLLSSLVLILVCISCWIIDFDPARVIRISIFINGVVIFLDIVAISAKKQTGDISHLWKISKLHASLVILMVIVVHLLALWLF